VLIWTFDKHDHSSRCPDRSRLRVDDDSKHCYRIRLVVSGRPPRVIFILNIHLPSLLFDMLYIFLTCVTAPLVATIAWRILGHPLRGFPGPPVAALTGLYAAYWDVVKYGRLLEHVTELHTKYGAFSKMLCQLHEQRGLLLHCYRSSR
jgi:hypothetical protein